MSNSSVHPGSHDAASYDELAPLFLRLSERYSGVHADRLLDRACLPVGGRVLDVGTGTGLVARRAAVRVGAEGDVLGIDLSAGMLDTARKGCGESGPARLEFRRMDAEALQLPDASRDAVVTLFSLLHLPHPERALAEAYRTLRPGGRLAVGVGSPPPLLTLTGMRRALDLARHVWRRRRGLELAAPDSLETIVRERMGLPGAATEGFHLDPHRVPEHVRAAGFAEVETSWSAGDHVIDDLEEFWDIQRVCSSPARWRLLGLPAEEIRAVRGELMDRARRVRARGGRLIYRTGVLFVTGVRPEHS